MHLPTTLRRRIYDITLARGTPPAIAELARTVTVTEAEIRQGLEQLAAARVLVLQPGSGEILMVPPFSAVPTPFVVETARHATYGNCAWDALGVPIMLRETGRIVSACGCCGESIAFDVSPSQPPRDSYVVHFAVPAARWWHDIVFT